MGFFDLEYIDKDNLLGIAEHLIWNSVIEHNSYKSFSNIIEKTKQDSIWRFDSSYNLRIGIIVYTGNRYKPYEYHVLKLTDLALAIKNGEVKELVKNT